METIITFLLVVFVLYLWAEVRSLSQRLRVDEAAREHLEYKVDYLREATAGERGPAPELTAAPAPAPAVPQPAAPAVAPAMASAPAAVASPTVTLGPVVQPLAAGVASIAAAPAPEPAAAPVVAPKPEPAPGPSSSTKSLRASASALRRKASCRREPPWRPGSRDACWPSWVGSPSRSGPCSS